MQLYELLFTILVLYMLYKLVFNVVVPVSKASATVRDRMREMQEQQSANPTNTKTHTSSDGPAGKSDGKSTESEYIDFEELK